MDEMKGIGASDGLCVNWICKMHSALSLIVQQRKIYKQENVLVLGGNKNHVSKQLDPGRTGASFTKQVTLTLGLKEKIEMCKFV